MYAWQFAKALYLADANGWTRFVSMQNHYNLLYREEEREMMPLCLEEQIAVLPNSSPAARLVASFSLHGLVRRPRASGLHGITAICSSRQSGIISRSSSR